MTLADGVVLLNSGSTFAAVRSVFLSGMAREKVLLNAGEKMSAFFIGGNPRLKNERVIFTGNDRYRLNTTCSGSVHLQISFMSKDFAENGVNCG